ncbi:MAG: hypothetical protein WCT16_02780 [Candidatus Buchananbacteria bacterium]
MAFPKTNEVSEYFKGRITWWYQTTLNNVKFKQLLNDHWLKFILYWMIFDAYLTEISQNSQDEQRLKYFFENSSDFKSHIVNKKISAKELKKLSPVRDMRPNHNERAVLNDENDLEQVFRFLYKIRCNLFHGAEDIKNTKDDSLVREGAKYLELVIESWITGQ